MNVKSDCRKARFLCVWAFKLLRSFARMKIELTGYLLLGTGYRISEN